MTARFALSTTVRAGLAVEILGIVWSTDRLSTPRELLWTIDRCPERKWLTRDDQDLSAWLEDRLGHVGGDRLHVSVGGRYGFQRWVLVRLGEVSPTAWLEQLFERLIELGRDQNDEIGLVLASDEADAQLVLTLGAESFRAVEVLGAVARLWQGKGAVATEFRRSSDAESERFLRELAKLPFVSWTESDASVVRPRAILVETYIHYDELATSRIEVYRSRDVIDAWLERQLDELGRASTYFLAPDRGTIRAEDRFLQLDLKGSAPWLPALFRPEPPQYSLILSADGERVLSFAKIPGDDRIYAAVHPLKAIVEVREAREAIDELLATTYPFLRVGYPPLHVNVRPAAVFDGEPTLELPLSSSPRRRATWLRDAFSRFRTENGGIDDTTGLRTLGHYGPYFLALPAQITAPWLCVYAYHDVDWLIALFEDQSLKSLLVMDGDEKNVLGLRRTDAHLQAFVRRSE